ncbi:hypothetical protein vseg_017859 [Gypsophila vaccaria]
MSVLSLNCRGLGHPDAVGELRNLIRREAPTLLFLCETKLSGTEMRRIRAHWDEYDGYEVDSVGRSGGLALLWRKGMQCSLRTASTHHIDVDVDLEGREWRLTGFYGWAAVAERYLSWQLLRELASTNNDSPWLSIGDFNEVLYSTEMKGG